MDTTLYSSLLEHYRLCCQYWIRLTKYIWQYKTKIFLILRSVSHASHKGFNTRYKFCYCTYFLSHILTFTGQHRLKLNEKSHWNLKTLHLFLICYKFSKCVRGHKFILKLFVYELVFLIYFKLFHLGSIKKFKMLWIESYCQISQFRHSKFGE